MRARNVCVTFRELPKLNHHFICFVNARDAFRERAGATDADPAVKAILDRLSQIGARPREQR